MIKNVRIRAIDGSAPGGLGARLLDFDLRDGKHQTPTRPISIPDFKAKRYLAFRGTLEGCLAAVQINLQGDRLASFRANNGAVIETARELTKFSDKSAFFENFAVLDVCPIAPNDDILKLLFEKQAEVPTLHNISLPPLATNDPDVYARKVTEWQKEAEGRGKGLVPQIDLHDDPALIREELKRLSQLAESDATPLVNLVYVDPKTHPLQYFEVWTAARDSRMIFNCSGVPRESDSLSSNLRESTAVQLERYGIDSNTPKTKRASWKYIYMMQRAPPPASVDEVDNWDWAFHPAGAYLAPEYWRGLPPHDVSCSCKLCKAKVQSEIIETYGRNAQGALDRTALVGMSRLHDGLSHNQELIRLQRRIEAREVGWYFDEMGRVRNAFGTSSASTTLA